LPPRVLHATPAAIRGSKSASYTGAAASSFTFVAAPRYATMLIFFRQLCHTSRRFPPSPSFRLQRADILRADTPPPPPLMLMLRAADDATTPMFFSQLYFTPRQPPSHYFRRYFLHSSRRCTASPIFLPPSPHLMFPDFAIDILPPCLAFAGCRSFCWRPSSRIHRPLAPFLSAMFSSPSASPFHTLAFSLFSDISEGRLLPLSPMPLPLQPRFTPRR